MSNVFGYLLDTEWYDNASDVKKAVLHALIDEEPHRKIVRDNSLFLLDFRDIRQEICDEISKLYPDPEEMTK